MSAPRLAQRPGPAHWTVSRTEGQDDGNELPEVGRPHGCPPFRPLRGAEPPHFVDRPGAPGLDGTGLLAGFARALGTGPADPRSRQLVLGGPAMGKTSLARTASRTARQQLDWLVVFHSCAPRARVLGVVAEAALGAVATQWPHQRAAFAGAVLRCRASAAARQREAWEGGTPEHPLPLPPGVGDGVRTSWSGARDALARVGRFAGSLGRGVLVVLDDLDALAAGEAEALGWLAHSLAGEGLPVSFLMTGSPALGERVREAGSFAGTLWHSELAPLDADEVQEALAVPAAERGVRFEHQAAQLVHELSGGAPLEVQRAGFHAWVSSGRRCVVSRADVQAGWEVAQGPGRAGPSVAGGPDALP